MGRKLWKVGKQIRPVVRLYSTVINSTALVNSSFPMDEKHDK